jgi:hypothetical protein
LIHIKQLAIEVVLEKNNTRTEMGAASNSPSSSQLPASTLSLERFRWNL